MQCYKCGYPDSRVVDTKPDDRNNKIVRRRECIKCGIRYNTHENPAYPEYKTKPPRSILER